MAFDVPLDPVEPHSVPDTHPLSSAWAKYNRAIELFEQAGQTADEIIPRQGNFRTESVGDNRVDFYEDPPFVVPLRFACLVGDTLHNCRSALDHAQWVLAAKHGPIADPTKVMFPLSGTAGEFKKRRPKLVEIVGETATLALERLQPYQDGRQALGWLRALDNVDKHRTLVIVTQWLAVKTASFVDSTGVERKLAQFGDVVPVAKKPGDPAFSLLHEPGRSPAVHVKAYFLAHFELAKGEDWPGNRVDTTLRRMLFDVEVCLTEIETIA